MWGGSWRPWAGTLRTGGGPAPLGGGGIRCQQAALHSAAEGPWEAPATHCPWLPPRVSCVSCPRHQGTDVSCCFTRMTLRVHLGPPHPGVPSLCPQDCVLGYRQQECLGVQPPLSSPAMRVLQPGLRGSHQADPEASRGALGKQAERWANTPATSHSAAECRRQRAVSGGGPGPFPVWWPNTEGLRRRGRARGPRVSSGMSPLASPGPPGGPLGQSRAPTRVCTHISV